MDDIKGQCVRISKISIKDKKEFITFFNSVYGMSECMVEIELSLHAYSILKVKNMFVLIMELLGSKVLCIKNSDDGGTNEQTIKTDKGELYIVNGDVICDIGVHIDS